VAVPTEANAANLVADYIASRPDLMPSNVDHRALRRVGSDQRPGEGVFGSGSRLESGSFGAPLDVGGHSQQESRGNGGGRSRQRGEMPFIEEETGSRGPSDSGSNQGTVSGSQTAGTLQAAGSSAALHHDGAEGAGGDIEIGGD